MARDTTRKGALFADGEQPLVLVGPPRGVRGEVRIQNPTDRKLIVRQPLLTVTPPAGAGGKARKAAAAMPDVGIALRRIVVRAGSSKPVPLTLTLDPRTPPGTYHAKLQVDGEERQVVMHVTEDVALELAPTELVLVNAAGRKIQKQIVVTNPGNVPVTVKTIGTVVLDDELAHCRALRGALADVGDTMKSLDDFTVALGRRYKSVYETSALRVQNDEATVEPGDTLAIDLTITLPDKLDKRSRYTGYAPISTRTLTFIVVPD
jgi:hypothetical protein